MYKVSVKIFKFTVFTNKNLQHNISVYVPKADEGFSDRRACGFFGRNGHFLY